MGSTRKKPVDTTNIWRSAEEIFYHNVDQADVEAYKTKFRLKDAVEKLKKGPSDSEKSHGAYKTRVHDKTVTTINTNNIVSKLELLLEFGDKVMVAAPETVSLVWLGLSTVGRIFIEDKKVSKIIEESTEQVAAAVLICEVYAQRYLGGHVEDQFRKTVHSLESQIPQLLAVILKFFYLAAKHLKKKGVTRILSSSFSTACKELRGAADDAKARVGALQSTAMIDFEDTTLNLLRGLHGNSNALSSLEKLTKRAFKSIDTRLNKIQDDLAGLGQQTVTKEIRSCFDANVKWFEQGRIAQLHSPVDIYRRNVKEKRHKGSCKWIFDEETYKEWNSKGSGLLWLQGGGGVGKSVLMSSVIESFDQTSKHSSASGGEGDPLLTYFFCKMDDESAEKSSKILLHLCAQLFCKAADSAHLSAEEQLFLQRACNSVVAKTTEDLADSERRRPFFMKMPALQTLFEDLGRVCGKPIVIIVDALDECADDLLLETLKSLASQKLKARVLVSSRSPPPSTNIRCIDIGKKKTRSDIRNYVSAALKKSQPRWSSDLQEKAILKITTNAQGMFKYASIVIERLQKPEAAFMCYSKFMRDLPEGINGLYRQKIEELHDSQRKILVTALRWLVCGGDTMQLLPIADELSEAYKSNEDMRKDQTSTESETAHDDASEDQGLENFAESFRKIGRDFLKVTGTTLQLEHNSVRDFVLSQDKLEQTDGNGTAALISEAGTKDGHLIMSEYLVQTLNSAQFQRRHICAEADQKRKASTRKSKKAPDLRYELVQWPKHLRNVELKLGYYRKRDKGFDERWNLLLQKAEQFMSANGKAYTSWLELFSTSQEDRSGDTPLHTASRYGLVSLMERYLVCGHANARNKNKDTPLHLACSDEGRFSGLDILLGACNMNLRNKNGATPILLAIKNLSRDIAPIKKLLDKGADPTIPDKSGTTCLHLAAAAHNTAVCELLLAHQTHRVEVDAKDRREETPLHWACKWPNAPTDLLKLLLNHHADLNAQDAESQAPLYEACKVANEEAANLLLRKGADINDDDKNSDTALHAAIYAGSLRTVKLLVKHNSSKLPQGTEAARKSQSGRVGKDLKAYAVLMAQAAKNVNAADLFKMNGEKREAVACAASRKEWEIMNYLLDVHQERGSDMRFLLQSDHRGMIPLHKSIYLNAYQPVKRLLEVGQPETPSNDGGSMSKRLDQKMCEATNANGNQALHMAAWRGNYSIFKLLMDHEAPPNSQGQSHVQYGDKPLDSAFRGWQECINIDDRRSRLFESIIEQLFYKVDAHVSGHAMKLQCAIERSSTKVFMLLKKWHFQKDEYGWTPALIAAAYGLKPENWQGTSNHRNPRTHQPTKWSPKDKDKRLNVSEDGMETSFKPHDPPKKYVMSIRANNPVQPDKRKFYFEIEIVGSQNEKPTVAVGFCSKLAYLNALPGGKYAHAFTWGYHGGSGDKYAQNHSGKKFSGRFGIGDTVGCGIDLTKGPGHGIIYFTRNGKHLGTAFKDVKGQLFPVVGIEANDTKVTVRVNFGHDKKKPFKYAEANHT